MKAKKLVFFVISLLLSFKAIQAQDFYDINTINVIELEFTETNWANILENYYNAGNDERLIATAIVNGIQYDSVGVKYKGNSSARVNSLKKPFNIKLDYVLDQDYQNYGTIKLSNVYKDPTFIRETLSYEIARKFMDAPLCNYAKLYINGDFIGLYTSSEAIDKKFVREHYFSDENARFKCNPTSGWGPGSGGGPSLQYLGSDSTSYYPYYELKSDNGWQDLVDLITTLKYQPEKIDSILNVDRTIWMLAFDNLLVNLDSYIGASTQNYYLYRDDYGRFIPTVWDLNESFGAFSQLDNNSGPGSSTNLAQLNPLYGQSVSSKPLLYVLLNDDRYRKMYLAHYQTIFEETIKNGWYFTRAQELQSIIDENVKADPNKFYTYSAFTSNLTSSYSSGGFGPQNQSILGISELMDARTNYLQSYQQFQYSSPTINEINVRQDANTNDFSVTITAKIENTSEAFVAFRNNTLEAFKKIPMSDNGLNDDGIAGNGVFGCKIESNSSKIQYYIYAENENASMFSPQTAEHEFYTYSIAGNVVINEMMANNDSTIADQDNEYDDWIELYNNSENPISLKNFFLSDKADNLTKWMFPDTVIQANGFLIIWADNDEDQKGLHTNFRLSASGETLFLVSPDTIIIDELNFGEQVPTQSLARFPNGTGAFSQMAPTFSANNGGNITDVSEVNFGNPSEYRLEQNYPNPFNPSTTISFSLPVSGQVSLKIYNTVGQLIKTLIDEPLSQGNHEILWQPENLPSGVYFYSLKSGSFSETKRMILLR